MKSKSLLQKGILAVVIATTLSFITTDASAWYRYHYRTRCWGGHCTKVYRYRQCGPYGCHRGWYRRTWYR